MAIVQPEQTEPKSPLPWEANLLVVAVLILVLVGGAAASALGLVATMLVTQAVLVLPALAWCGPAPAPSGNPAAPAD
jgi:hypothetical protein